MRYALLVAWREYVENVKTKGFWIGIVLFPAILLLAIQVPVFLEAKGTPVRHFVVLDQSGQFESVIDAELDRQHRTRSIEALRAYAQVNARPAGPGIDPPDQQIQQIFNVHSDASIDELVERLQPYLKTDAPAFTPPRRRFERVPLPDSIHRGQPLPEVREQLRPYLTQARSFDFNGQTVSLYAAILIPSEIAPASRTKTAPAAAQPRTENQVEYWSVNLADQSLRELVENSIEDEVRRQTFIERGIDLQLVRQIEQIEVPFATLNPKKEKGEERVRRVDVMRQWAPIGFVYILWVGIFAIAQMLLNNMIEEKSNRILEVLLSSVTPAELMMGKLVGIAAVGLTMIAAWLAALVAILTWKSTGQAAVAGQLLSILQTSNLIPAFILYFVLGYLTYAGIILAIGSVCNTLKEAQNYMGVITILLVVPLLTMTFIPKDPNGTLARVLSWIPLYTPFVMMNRAMADPPWIDVIGTLVLMVVFTALVLWMSVKIFRIGVLRTGQPPKVLELIRWLRARH